MTQPINQLVASQAHKLLTNHIDKQDFSFQTAGTFIEGLGKFLAGPPHHLPVTPDQYDQMIKDLNATSDSKRQPLRKPNSHAAIDQEIEAMAEEFADDTAEIFSVPPRPEPKPVKKERGTTGPKSTPVIAADGRRFNSGKEAAKHYGLTTSAVYHKLRAGTDGWRYEQEPVRIGKPVFTPDGQFRSINAAARFYDVTPLQMNDRLIKEAGHGFINTRVKRNAPGIANPVLTQEGRFDSVMETARHFHVDVSTVYDRIRHGVWHYETTPQVSGTPIETPAGRFPSINAAARHYKVSPHEIYQRLKMPGWRRLDISQSMTFNEPVKTEVKEAAKATDKTDAELDDMAWLSRYYN